MNLVTQNCSCDKFIWRCHKRNPKHDIKVNIRTVITNNFTGLSIELFKNSFDNNEIEVKIIWMFSFV